MTDDKDSAVPDSAMLDAIDWHLHKRMAIDYVCEPAENTHQPTQSDAVLDGDTQTILYLLGVRHGREDERAKIAAEASQPTQSDALREALEKVITSSNLEKAHEIAATTLEELRQPTQSDDEAYDLGKRDGYEKAVQDIDMLTGGDGEYCYSTIGGERHCPDADSMKARIAERFNSQPKTVTVTVVSAADGKAIHKFKIDPTKKTIVRPEHSLFGYVFEPEGDTNDRR